MVSIQVKTDVNKLKNRRWTAFILGALFLTACKHDPIITEPKTDEPIVSIDCEPNTVYFVNQIMPIISSNCAFSGCHGNGSAQDGVDLSTYSSIINTGEITPFDLEDSDLYEVITENDLDDRMPPPPNSALSQEQINLIAAWINQGALNNSCTDCDSENTTWTLGIEPIIVNSCQGCHSGTSPDAGLNLSTFDAVQTVALNGALIHSLNGTNNFTQMPYQSDGLPQCQIDQITTWVENGAQNN